MKNCATGWNLRLWAVGLGALLLATALSADTPCGSDSAEFSLPTGYNNGATGQAPVGPQGPDQALADAKANLEADLLADQEEQGNGCANCPPQDSVFCSGSAVVNPDAGRYTHYWAEGGTQYCHIWFDESNSAVNTYHIHCENDCPL